MVGTNLKAETMSLMEKRTAVEAEMNAIIHRLSQPGGPGLSGNLIDAEGFPRSDIDILHVRAERRRLAELRNDHQEISEKINENIQLLHSARLSNVSSCVKDSGNDADSNQNSSLVNADASAFPSNNIQRDSPVSMDVDLIISKPFALIDEITDASPAAEDGLQLGDQIVKFGKVEAGENLLERLASEGRSNLGQAVPVVIMRQGAVINLTVTPRTWQGRGLLGCHFRIL
ncbi:26S proteasome non-ATPase regulatory subunit 9-like isoform X1 [Mangifera indica]|uniref:26S proteasome non-ATPase regulatory subunit 9-like isoform X1 n=1 Tax=Mangifera indica TaxID=29780 RepID=UPI001CFAFAE5|nr:26S proteasome non-ATPase regulatory subunit 9-like isoform X1 [Mangifera indica]XP_044471114.1 26S proteasome non-ATPase regulatory subunit 9-like isoform X1 [Mangifera indica]XP_044471115.1 26S proteasome non-ATPase regulatory subunit 9-like isoform X1 [Mangifera indica]